MSRGDGRVEILLVSSPGGHLFQLLALRPAWEGFARHWVTLDASDTRSLLAEESATYAHGPTTRSIVNLTRNLVLAWKTVRRTRPRVVLTTGAGVSVPFAWIGRAHGAQVVFVESLTRIDTPSLSCRLVAPVASRVYVQWPELEGSVRRSRFAGSLLVPH